MLVSRTRAYSPLQKTDTRATGPVRTDRTGSADARYDSISLSGSTQQSSAPDFRQLVSSLSQQVRTYNTTSKVQELRAQVQSGAYTISPSDIAARMLLLEEGV